MFSSASANVDSPTAIFLRVSCLKKSSEATQQRQEFCLYPISAERLEFCSCLLRVSQLRGSLIVARQYFIVIKAEALKPGGHMLSSDSATNCCDLEQVTQGSAVVKARVPRAPEVG